MARRRKKKNNSRKIWFVLILLCAVSLLGWKIWTSDEVQMRFVYMCIPGLVGPNITKVLQPTPLAI